MSVIANSTPNLERRTSTSQHLFHNSPLELASTSVAAILCENTPLRNRNRPSGDGNAAGQSTKFGLTECLESSDPNSVFTDSLQPDPAVDLFRRNNSNRSRPALRALQAGKFPQNAEPDDSGANPGENHPLPIELLHRLAGNNTPSGKYPGEQEG